MTDIVEKKKENGDVFGLEGEGLERHFLRESGGGDKRCAAGEICPMNVQQRRVPNWGQPLDISGLRTGHPSPVER